MANKSASNNIVNASYIKNQARRGELQAQAKREKEGRKIGMFHMQNQFREKYTIIKWDLLFDLVILATFLWVQVQLFLAVFVFLQIYIASYFIFTYRKYRLAPFIMSLSIIPFFFYFVFPNLETSLRGALFFCGWAIVSYGLFWFIIIFKNRKEFENAQEDELCMVCNQQKDEFIIHMGRYLCKDCFLEQAYTIVEYHDTEMFKSDYDVLNYLEHEISERIPNYNLSDDKDIFKPEFENKLFFSIENNNVTAISIPNKNIKIILPEEIGLLHTLRILNLHGNRISKLPYSFRELYHLEIINLKDNDLDFLPAHSLKSLALLKRRGCIILK